MKIENKQPNCVSGGIIKGAKIFQEILGHYVLTPCT